MTALKDGFDAVCAIAIFGAILGALPNIAAGFAIAWYIYRFYQAFKNKNLTDS